MNPQILGGGLVTTEILPASSRTANVNGAGVDIRDYVGTVQVIVASGNISAGDDNSTFAVQLIESDDTNISNGSDISGALVTATNVGNVQTLSVDTRQVKRYLFAQGNIAGANSPAFPIAVVATGVHQTA